MSITILGLGGCGSNITNQINKNFSDFNFKIIDTNNKVNTNLDKKDIFFLGNGLGSGMNPAVALQLAKNKEKELLEFIKKPELLFLVAGVGGTGNGLTDYLSTFTEAKGSLPIVYIVKPSKLEPDRMPLFEGMMGILKKNNYSYMVIDNQKIIDKYKDQEVPPHFIYEKANVVLSQSLKTIENLKNSGEVDLNDIKTVLKYKGYFLADTTKGNSFQECKKKIEGHPFLDFKLESLKGSILRISYGKIEPSFKEIQPFVEWINSLNETNGKSKIVFQKTEQEKIQLDLILTGINSQTL
jgi:cell division GTPase FtsZ